MGWKPWDLERLAHPADFIEAIKGFQYRQAWQVDCAAFVAVQVLNAAGVTKTPELGGGPFTMQDLLGRPPFERLMPEIPLTEAEQELRDLDEAARRSKSERARFQVWAAQKAKAARDRGETF